MQPTQYDYALHDGSAREACSSKPRRKGVLPPDIQGMFDHAKSLERGRKGRSLADMVRPQIAAALEAYDAAFVSLDALELTSPDIERVRGSYAQRVEELKQQVASSACERLPFDEALRAFAICRYDTERHDLLGTSKRVLEVAGHEHLNELHLKELSGPPPLCPALLCALNMSRKLPPSWGLAALRRKEHIRAFSHTPEYAAWLSAFRRFVHEVICPLVGEDVVFQCPPTLRCQLPSLRALGHRHRDDEYAGHQGEEINFWLPLTRVQRDNTLHVETRPGSNEFRPLEIDYGEFARFNGAQCEHYTTPNITQDTRVSFDFRVIPLSQWRNEFGGRIGTYPCETTACKSTVL